MARELRSNLGYVNVLNRRTLQQFYLDTRDAAQLI